MIGSSAPYTASLCADRGLRRLVLGSGVVCFVTGLVILTALPVAAPGRAVLALAWCALSAAELALFKRAYRECTRLTLHADGSVEVERSGGGRREGRLLPGSVVLQEWAWLRVEMPGRWGWAEPLRARAQDSEQWRRFQVICRHLTAC